MTATPSRVFFTGSRTYNEPVPGLVAAIIRGLRSNLWDERGAILDVAHGAAQGLDDLVDRLIGPNENIRVFRYRAAWGLCDTDHRTVPCPLDNGKHRRLAVTDRRSESTYCPIAGLRRNQEMLDGFEPELVLAFIDKPLKQSRGTNDMVQRASKAGVPYHVITSRSTP